MQNGLVTRRYVFPFDVLRPYSCLLLQTLETIKSHFLGSPSYVVDPHTAVGLTAAARMANYKCGEPTFLFIHF